MSDRYEIWQLRDTPEAAALLFMDTDFLARHDLTVDLSNYVRMYGGELEAGTTLEDLYARFNLRRPEDFFGHSMSVSDLIILEQGGEVSAHYCDSLGFMDVSDFVVPDYEQMREKPSIRQRLKEAREKQREQSTQGVEKSRTNHHETSL